jgi:zinc transport system permease protein
VLEFSFMRIALVASVAAGVSLGLVGVYLVIRRIVFMGLVLANAATVGAAVGQIFHFPAEAGSIVATVVAALALGAIQTPRRISSESLMGWAYAAASSATVLILARTAGADMDTLHLLYGNLLAVSPGHAAVLAGIALAVGLLQVLFARRFLLVTFDPEAASVAGVRATLWSVGLNLLIGVATAAAVHEIGALLTFSLLTLAPAASLLVTRSIHATFAVSAGLGSIVVCLGLVASFYLDLPPGPTSVALLALAVPIAAGVGRLRA